MYQDSTMKMNHILNSFMDQYKEAIKAMKAEAVQEAWNLLNEKFSPGDKLEAPIFGKYQIVLFDTIQVRAIDSVFFEYNYESGEQFLPSKIPTWLDNVIEIQVFSPVDQCNYYTRLEEFLQATKWS